MDKPEQAKFRIAGNTGGRFFSNAECLAAPEKTSLAFFRGRAKIALRNNSVLLVIFWGDYLFMRALF